jgi:hypothetical protein
MRSKRATRSRITTGPFPDRPALPRAAVSGIGRARPALTTSTRTARFNQSMSYDAYDEYRIDLRVNLGVVRTN